MITALHINFFGLGKVNKNGMQNVYIRYLYTKGAKKVTRQLQNKLPTDKRADFPVKSQSIGRTAYRKTL